MKKMCLVAVAGLLLACGGGGDKSDVNADVAVDDAVEQRMDTTSPGKDAYVQQVQHELTCSDEWQHCHQIGETWPQSYPKLTPDEAYQLALRWVMCGSMDLDGLPHFFKSALATSLAYSMPAVDAPSMACMLAAQDCNEVRCCWGIDSGSACDSESIGNDHCDGNSVVSTWPMNVGEDEVVDLVRKWDCGWSNGNPKCLMTTAHDADDQQVPICGVGSCVDGTPDSCDGNVLVLCISGVERRVDCAERGRICAPHATDEEDMQAACVLATQCLLPHCEDDVAVFCEGGNEVVRIDCTAYGPGFTCLDGQIQYGEWEGGCFNPDAACDQWDDDYCDGDTVHYCTDDGHWVSFDCSAFADGTCASVPDSIDLGPSPGPGAEKELRYRPTCVEGLEQGP